MHTLPTIRFTLTIQIHVILNAQTRALESLTEITADAYEECSFAFRPETLSLVILSIPALCSAFTANPNHCIVFYAEILI